MKIIYSDKVKEKVEKYANEIFGDYKPLEEKANTKIELLRAEYKALGLSSSSYVEQQIQRKAFGDPKTKDLYKTKPFKRLAAMILLRKIKAGEEVTTPEALILNTDEDQELEKLRQIFSPLLAREARQVLNQAFKNSRLGVRWKDCAAEAAAPSRRRPKLGPEIPLHPLFRQSITERIAAIASEKKIAEALASRPAPQPAAGVFPVSFAGPVDTASTALQPQPLETALAAGMTAAIPPMTIGTPTMSIPPVPALGSGGLALSQVVLTPSAPVVPLPSVTPAGEEGRNPTVSSGDTANATAMTMFTSTVPTPSTFVTPLSSVNSSSPVLTQPPVVAIPAKRGILKNVTTTLPEGATPTSAELEAFFKDPNKHNMFQASATVIQAGRSSSPEFKLNPNQEEDRVIMEAVVRGILNNSSVEYKKTGMTRSKNPAADAVWSAQYSDIVPEGKEREEAPTQDTRPIYTRSSGIYEEAEILHSLEKLLHIEANPDQDALDIFSEYKKNTLLGTTILVRNDYHTRLLSYLSHSGITAAEDPGNEFSDAKHSAITLTPEQRQILLVTGTGAMLKALSDKWVAPFQDHIARHITIPGFATIIPVEEVAKWFEDARELGTNPFAVLGASGSVNNPTYKPFFDALYQYAITHGINSQEEMEKGRLFLETRGLGGTYANFKHIWEHYYYSHPTTPAPSTPITTPPSSHASSSPLISEETELKNYLTLLANHYGKRWMLAGLEIKLSDNWDCGQRMITDATILLTNAQSCGDLISLLQTTGVLPNLPAPLIQTQQGKFSIHLTEEQFLQYEILRNNPLPTVAPAPPAVSHTPPQAASVAQSTEEQKQQGVKIGRYLKTLRAETYLDEKLNTQPGYGVEVLTDGRIKIFVRTELDTEQINFMLGNVGIIRSDLDAPLQTNVGGKDKNEPRYVFTLDGTQAAALQAKVSPAPQTTAPSCSR